MQREADHGEGEQATALSVKTVPSETAMSSSPALVMGAMQRWALPPQIAVPHVMRNAALGCSSACDPARCPADGAHDADCGISEARSARVHYLMQVHAKARATTEACSSSRERSRLSDAKGCGSSRPKAMPAPSATLGRRSRWQK